MARELKRYRGWAWCSRAESDPYYIEIRNSETAPVKTADGLWRSSDDIDSIAVCAYWFTRVTGIHIEPGECVKVWFGAVL